MDKNIKIDKIEQFFDRLEPVFFKFKYMVILAIIGALFIAFILFGYGFYEAIHIISFLGHKSEKIIELTVLSAADMFLFGMVMLIFAFGSYNLFVSKLDNIQSDSRDNIVPNWVQVSNFGDLKAIFTKVIAMILGILFVELVIKNFEKFNDNLYSLLILPAGVFLIAISQKFLHSDHQKSED